MLYKICPRCGSKKVKWIIPQNWSTWQCFDCEYTGPIIEGDDELARQIHENYLNPEQFDDEEEFFDEDEDDFDDDDDY